MIPVAVTARNEEAALGPCLESVLAAVRHAEDRLPLRFAVLVVLNDCTDGTAAVARRFPVEVLETSGGLVAAQRAAVRPAPFLVFSDADIYVTPPTLAAVCTAMLEDPTVQVAYPPKSPLPPRRRGLLAEALHVFNRDNGYQTRRHYFNGKFFAIRRWQVPTAAELRPRWGRLPRDRFHALERGVITDDIYLSRAILAEHGPAAIREVAEGRVWFRAPETFGGMYRFYRRMRLEIQRLDALFPDSRAVHRRYGVRGLDRAAFRRASPRDRCLWRLFQLSLLGCKVRFALERFWYRHLARSDCPIWEPIPETKAPITGPGEGP
jgi:glycosyltransferase involved in cell wall biosynthesis